MEVRSIVIKGCMLKIEHFRKLLVPLCDTIDRRGSILETRGRKPSFVLGVRGNHDTNCSSINQRLINNKGVERKV